MNISWDRTGGLLRRMGSFGMLKSTRDRLERQEETQRQVDFFEQQKDNLKNIKCSSVEEIAEKLNMLHSYEDQIAAAKAAYNSEQIWHILDESTERGEKIAEAAEKMKPKTPEERQEELVEEALGIEDSGGVLEEILDEVEELTEELTEEILEDLPEETTQDLTQEIPADATEPAGAASAEDLEVEAAEVSLHEEIMEAEAGNQEKTLEMLRKGYVPFDVRL